MKSSAFSLFVFGLYMLVLGPVLVLTPNTLLEIFGFPLTQEIWIRVVGMLVILLGVYDVGAARAGLEPFIRLSVPVRGSVILFFGAFVALRLVEPALLLFGAVDALGATWTVLALRREASEGKG